MLEPIQLGRAFGVSWTLLAAWLDDSRQLYRHSAPWKHLGPFHWYGVCKENDMGGRSMLGLVIGCALGLLVAIGASVCLVIIDSADK
jgi:hypothetical protein